MRAAICASMLIFLLGNVNAKPLNIVFVANASSKIPFLSNAQLRQVYLGFPLNINGAAVRPLLNRSDPVLAETFLQKTLFMSMRAYERHEEGVSLAKSRKLAVYRSESKLLHELLLNPNAITYLTKQKATEMGHASLKIIGRP